MTERVELGVDGNCAFALLGEDLQSGEAEFVEIKYRYGFTPMSHDEVLYAGIAFDLLQKRLGRPLTFYYGPSHPYGD